MYVRVSSTPNSPRKAVKVVASYRENGKVKQRIVHYVGVASNKHELENLKQLGYEYIEQEKEKLNQLKIFKSNQTVEEAAITAMKAADQKRKVGRKPRVTLKECLPISQVTLDQVIEEKRIIEGVDEVVGKVYDYLGYNDILSGKKDKKLLKDLVLARVVQPASKYKTQKNLAKQFNKFHDLNRIYRILDKLQPKIGKIKRKTFQQTVAIVPENVSIMLFDVTTLYFESEKSDDLREYGYSKDHRFNTTQVVFALATNSDGLPFGYELFKGNKAEVKTLCESIESWSKDFNIGSVCFVGDRAMMSQSNINLLEKMNYNYVIAAKLRSMTTGLQEKILDTNNYESVMFGDTPGQVGEFSYKGQRLIVSHKQARANNDAKKREKMLETIKKRLGKKGDTKKLITNHGVKKYTSSQGSETKIDNDKVLQDAKWDGLHGVVTNLKDSKPLEILKYYSRLWVIEDSFRLNKHTLSMRPIYHFKKERIEAHIALCYMAFVALRHLQYKTSLRAKLSPECIIEELLSVQASIYVHKITGDRYRVPGSFSHIATKIYKALNVERNLNAEPFLSEC